jgi:hypothetical protein
LFGCRSSGVSAREDRDVIGHMNVSRKLWKTRMEGARARQALPRGGVGLLEVRGRRF